MQLNGYLLSISIYHAFPGTVLSCSVCRANDVQEWQAVQLKGNAVVRQQCLEYNI